MSGYVILTTDVTSHGGSITPKGPVSVTVRGTQVALVGDQVLCPNCPNNDGDPVITTISDAISSLDLNFNGVKMAIIGSGLSDICQATFVSTTNNVLKA